MICGDGLMSHQPMIEDIIEEMMHYLLVAKPGDHTYLFEWLEAFSELPSMDWIDEKGHQHHYRWKNNVPLHGEKNAIEVNFLNIPSPIPQGKLSTEIAGSPT
ncbi:hypothetical protein [sulfur-oxidizing endosymbiont of Gigantopelta aegis]|uniref:hypothetical protein n=1 Tax=sulfur-oxidizing endosymbiont of Gigantopelta aegis TaxID=2794934 RepID=UPI0018DC1555|nr:hypothetical protein [sulfur-oxidizing endosymbiont of Gigantopelta aegis]